MQAESHAALATSLQRRIVSALATARAQISPPSEVRRECRKHEIDSRCTSHELDRACCAPLTVSISCAASQKGRGGPLRTAPSECRPTARPARPQRRQLHALLGGMRSRRPWRPARVPDFAFTRSSSHTNHTHVRSHNHRCIVDRTSSRLKLRRSNRGATHKVRSRHPRSDAGMLQCSLFTSCLVYST